MRGLMKKLYVFDMDGTLLPNTTGMLQIAKLTGHVEHLECLEKKLWNQEIDNRTFAKGIFDLWEGLTPEILKESFIQTPKIGQIKEVVEKIASTKGVSCLITSAPNFFADFFYEYGFNYIYASRPFAIQERKFTPELIIGGKQKPFIAAQLCQELGLQFEQTVAFGDSLSDVPLFQRLNHTISVNGDHHIKQYAKHHYQGLYLKEALDIVL